MGTDDLFKRRKEKREIRKSRGIELRKASWLIVCEGKETEVNYFECLLDYVNSKSSKKIKRNIKGLGMNTDTLVKSVEDLLSETENYIKDSIIPYEKIFVVFDKDSFSNSDFNEAINRSERLGYIPLWSNECFELWYILHFEYFTSSSGRELYFNKLSKLFEKKYSKTDNHFNLLGGVSNISTAYKNASKLYKEFSNEKFRSYSKMKPCTTVFMILDEIENTIGVKLK